MRHVVIGTAGHVDHGKTALVQALTDVQTDRLPEEQRRGITIELGFAPWRLSDEVIASVIDAPGHRRLVHTMIAGAAGIDLVLLAVAGDEGVMPQTREHVAVCKLLGVQRAVVAVTKMDRVDADLGELAGEEALELLEAHGIEGRTVCCSARSGDGVDEVRQAMLETVEAVAPRVPGPHVRLWVDRVFTVHGSGTVVTGTLVEGELHSGQSLRVLGAQREIGAVARGLHVHGQACESAEAPTRLAINLAIGAGRGRGGSGEVERGDLITSDEHLEPTRLLDVALHIDQAIRRGSEASIFVGTSRSTARIQPLSDAKAGEGVLARLRLKAPLVVAGGERFVLRGAKVDGPVGAVVGGGVVLDARPPARVRAAKRAALLAAAEGDDATALIRALVAEAAPRSLLRGMLPSRLKTAAAQLVQTADELSAAGELVALGAAGWTARASLDSLHERARQLVGEHHRNAPLEPGLPLQTLREQLTAAAGPEATVELVGRLTAGSAGPGEPSLVIEDDVVRLSTFTGAEQDEGARRALDAARAALREAALQGVTEHALGEAIAAQGGADPKQARPLIALLVRTDQAIRSGDLCFDATAIAELRRQVLAHLDEAGTLSIQQFKELTGMGRRQVIPLLEYFDRQKVTRREGDARVRGS